MNSLRIILCRAFLMAIVISEVSLAAREPAGDDIERPIAKEDVVAVRTYTAPRVGQMHVVVRKDGHQQKMPYLFELRATCGGPRRKWEHVKIGNVSPSCDADPKTIQYDAKKAVVTMMVRNIDWEGFDKKIREVGNDKAGEPVCKPAWELSTLSLAELCPKN